MSAESPEEMVEALEAEILAKNPELSARDIRIQYDEETGTAEASYLRAKDGTPAGGFGGAE